MNSFIKFCIVGIFSTAINYLVYLYFLSTEASIFLSSTFGYGCGTLTSYHFGRIWVFGKEHQLIGLDLIKFIMIYSINGYIVALVTSALSEVYLIDHRVSWLIAILYGLLGNYFGSKLFIFKDPHEN